MVFLDNNDTSLPKTLLYTHAKKSPLSMHTSREYTSTYVSEFSFVFSTKSFAVEDTKKERKNTTSFHLPKTILAHALLYTTLVATTRLSFHGV